VGVELLPTSHHLQGPGSSEDNERAPTEAMPMPPQATSTYEIEHFPGTKAGAPIKMRSAGAAQSPFTVYHQQLSLNNNSMYAPFASKMDWEVAKWAKLRGPSSSAFNELLQIDGVADGLSYKNAQQLNALIDQKLPCRPVFHRHDIQIGGERLVMYSRDILHCIQAIYSNPEFSAHLIHKPERHFRHSGNERIRVFHDMHTGSWWWKAQVC
jgi:hypothetical protein